MANQAKQGSDMLCLAQFISEGAEKSNTVLQRCYKDCKDNALCVVGEFKENYLQITGGFDSDNLFRYAEGKHNTLIASGRDKTGVLLTDKRIRRLTPIECERLQTVPDNYTAAASDTERYRMLGNG